MADDILSSRRISSVDIVADEALDAHQLSRELRLSATHFHAALTGIKKQVDHVVAQMPTTTLPRRVIATLLQPAGNPAQRLAVEAFLPGKTAAACHTVSAIDGMITLTLPRGSGLRQDERLKLVVRGPTDKIEIQLSAEDIGASGVVGSITLPKALTPLPVSIIASLEKLVAGAADDAPAPAPAQVEQPIVKLGEDDDVCTRLFGADAGVDRFPYSVLFRLVEPRTSVLTRAYRLGSGKDSVHVAVRGKVAKERAADKAGQGGGLAQVFVDRVPVDQPISVDDFRDEIIGLGADHKIDARESFPVAGTLGLGYVVHMAQHWTPLGVSLGDLVYSLPLAPGEQQRVAMFERREQTAVLESEDLSVAEQQTFEQQQDTSARATFDQAFQEAAAGGSSFWSKATSESSGFNILIASGGSGSSSNQGGTSSWMEGQRHVSSQAAEDTHASLERAATARRSAQRTSMRMASASEAQDVTTKVITNHNHTRALTLQYWQVNRLFDVTSSVQGVTLVCFVPLDVVRFLPAGQLLTLDENNILSKRSQVLRRYSEVLKHSDRLASVLPRRYRHGLDLLTEFAADPRATVDTAPGNAEDVIEFKLHGGFLPCERIWVSAVTRRGTRLGPALLTGDIPPIRDNTTDGQIDPKKAFVSEADLFSHLRRRREDNIEISGRITLPPSLARADIVGFEITRGFQGIDVTFCSAALKAAEAITALGSLPAALTFAPILLGAETTTTAHYGARELEQHIGGPEVWGFSAKIVGSSETYASNGERAVLPPGAYPIPALEVAPVLRYSALLQIEKVLQHVVRNTLRYSHAIWTSLTPTERVILLERFTIGVPSGGQVDESQDIPLLNCVSNKVLGFYGNSMILPFIIPAGLSQFSDLNSAQVQDALTQFHRTGFEPPHSRIALPTHGVLGEAILGHCPSAEKIDLTRFWNWQDSPADNATAIGSVTLPTSAPSIAAGLQAPNTLTGMQPLIQNFNNQPPIPIDTSLVGQLSAAAQAQKDFTGLTNATELAGLIKTTQGTAESARADALKRATELQSQAMTEIGNFFGAKGGEAYASNYRDTPGGGGASGTGGGGGSSSAQSPYQQLLNAKNAPAKKPATKPPAKAPAKTSTKPAAQKPTPQPQPQPQPQPDNSNNTPEE